MTQNILRFGRLIQGTGSFAALDNIAKLNTNKFDQPEDALSATIEKATIIENFDTSGFPAPERNTSFVKKSKNRGRNCGSVHQHPP